MTTRTNVALVTAGLASLVLAGCGQKEASAPVTEAAPIAAAPHDDSAASAASAPVDAAPHAEGADAHDAAGATPAAKAAGPTSDMSGMDMTKK
ncbi:MAG: hypothetical protein DI570_06955 [Phenylobacterium zucineum]|nr:MAG: hypothetical protein DI570_06955 [Phenylobacterium zucineum]